MLNTWGSRVRLVVLVALALLTLSQPTPQRVQRQTTTHYVFLPMVVRQSPPPKRGVGMPAEHEGCEQPSLVGAVWQYNWGNPLDCPGMDNVPMIWRGSIPASLNSSPYLLLFNEPNNPDQANLTPQEAAVIAAQAAERFPEKKLIVGNTYDGYWSGSQIRTGAQWLSEFLALYSNVAGLGFHCYWQTASQCIAVGQGIVSLAQGREVWCTEFAFWAQDWTEAGPFIDWMESEPMIKRYAWFATRIDGDEPWLNQVPAWMRAPLLDSNNQKTYWGMNY